MPKRTKNESPQKQALREMMRDYLKNNDVSIRNGTDVNAVMRDMMSVLLEGALDEELDEELGYSKYDYRNKETDNSRNGHSTKTMHTSYGDMDVAIPRDRKGEFEPQIIKKYQNTVSQDMEEKIISMYAKGMTTADIESHMKELFDILYYDNYIVDSEIIDKPLEKLSLSDGQKFFLHCKAKKPDIKRKYWNNVHGLLNNIFRYAINEGLVQSNPFDNLSIGTNSFAPDAKHKDSDTTFSPDEQAAICSCAEETAISKKTALPLGIVLTFNLGIRLGELCAMKWSDLEESSHVHYVHIQRELVAEINDKGKVIGYTVLDHCKTPAGDRRLVLNSKAQDLFNTIRTLNIQNGIPVGENDYVFMRIRKKQLQLCNHKVFDSRIRVYCRHSGMSEAKSFHDIRRTVLTNLYYAGMPLKDIQKFAGHTSLQQTMDYIKIKEDDISTLSYLEALSTSKMDSKSDENDPKAVFKVA